VLRQRVITAVVLLALFLASAAAGRLPLDALLAMTLAAAAYEWLRLAQHPAARSVALAAAFGVALLALETLTAWPDAGALLALLGVTMVAWLAIGATIMRGAHQGTHVHHSLATALGLLLLGAGWFSLMHLMDEGFIYLLSVLVIVWLADIAAYFAGRRWGRRKLAPAISPGKTWAGVGGAVVAVLVVAAAVAFAMPGLDAFSTRLLRRLPLAMALLVLAALVAQSIVGDLFESLLKRQVGAKDSGTLLPGHGGVLDRIDALIALLPAAALIDLWLRR